MRSLGVLLVRLVIGGLLAGHGGQKLFGWFGGAGMRGTAGWMETMQLRPGAAWARLAGGSEFGGGVLTMLGLLSPLGSVAAIGAMLMAWAKVHRGRPVWITTGGAELPVTNIAVLAALALGGPGRLSADGLLGIRAPVWIRFAALAGVGAAFVAGARTELEESLRPLLVRVTDAIATQPAGNAPATGEPFDAMPATTAETTGADSDGTMHAESLSSLAGTGDVALDRGIEGAGGIDAVGLDAVDLDVSAGLDVAASSPTDLENL